MANKITLKLCAFADESDEKLSGQIAALKRNKIHYIEIRGVNGKNVLSLTDQEAKKAYSLLKKNDIEVYSIGSPIGKVDITVNEIDFLNSVKRGCELAKIFHTENIRMFSFYKSKKQKKKVFDLLNKAVAIAKEYSVYLCHENEKDIYGDIEPFVSELLDKVPGLCFVYDTANFICCGQRNSVSIPTVLKRAKYIHIKDAIFKTKEIVPAGEGDGQIKKILTLIKSDTVLSIEPHLKVFTGYANIDPRELKSKYHFKSNNDSFDCAVKSLKKVLKNAGYRATKSGFVK